MTSSGRSLPDRPGWRWWDWNICCKGVQRQTSVCHRTSFPASWRHLCVTLSAELLLVNLVAREGNDLRSLVATCASLRLPPLLPRAGVRNAWQPEVSSA
jgi:hypothetical protein